MTQMTPIDPVEQMLAETGDEPLQQRSSNPHFSTILSRRKVLGGSLGAAVAGMFAASPAAAQTRGGDRAAERAARLGPKLGFDAIPVLRSDTATLPAGYKAQALVPWGTPITGSYPAYDGVNGNTGAQQEQQVGSHHDGIHYFPMADDPNGHGILCINHEYVDQRVLHVAGPTFVNGQRPTDEVRKEIAAHGVSVVEVRRDASGTWNVVPGVYNRRITAGTVCEIGGPVRGSEYVKTVFSPDGTRARGTINNCGNGYTPWNTYLTCEENWAGYFVWRANQARADALLSWFEATQPELYPGPKASFVQGRYYARYYPETNRILGIFDEIQDQKVTNIVYTQEGQVFSDAGRTALGTMQELLAQAGLDEDLSLQLPREMQQFGVPTVNSRYRWETALSGEDQYVRFDATPRGRTAVEDYRNEPNGHGWILEIDPFNPSGRPIKRTAMGRFAHEAVVFAPPRNFEPLAFYSGDDSQDEYIYKFVTRQRWIEGRPDRNMLDKGTLYVAVFKEDGTGEWRALDINDPAFQAAAAAAGVSFANQADVLVNTRLAADIVGATKMDRPEWGAVDPKTGLVYFTLTNNTTRKEDQVDAANPRPNSRWGHIIRWEENGGDSAATTFKWDIFILAGPKDDSQFDGKALTDDQFFNSPDGLWFDKDSRLWIQTDISESVMNTGDFTQFGNNQMLACDPVNKDLRRFLTGPVGQEITGVITTPDQKTMFMNVQHPGATTSPDDFAAGNLKGTWPHNARYGRSATVVITKDDGGVIGT